MTLLLRQTMSKSKTLTPWKYDLLARAHSHTRYESSKSSTTAMLFTFKVKVKHF